MQARDAHLSSAVMHKQIIWLVGINQCDKQIDAIQRDIESARPPWHCARAAQVHHDYWEQGDVDPGNWTGEILDLELESTFRDEARLDRPRNRKSQKHVLHI